MKHADVLYEKHNRFTMWKVVVKYYYMLGNIFRIYQKQVFQQLLIDISYPKNATFVIAN